MSDIGHGLGLLTTVGLVKGISHALKPTPVQAPLQIDRQAQAAAMVNAQDDALRRRRGAAANALTGPGGAEASTPGAKVLLGQ